MNLLSNHIEHILVDFHFVFARKSCELRRETSIMYAKHQMSMKATSKWAPLLLQVVTVGSWGVKESSSVALNVPRGSRKEATFSSSYAYELHNKIAIYVLRAPTDCSSHSFYCPTSLLVPDGILILFTSL